MFILSKTPLKQQKHPISGGIKYGLNNNNAVKVIYERKNLTITQNCITFRYYKKGFNYENKKI